VTAHAVQEEINMRNAIAGIAVILALVSVPGVSMAQATSGQAKPAKSSGKAASHATTGVVKSISDTTLVITRPGKPASEMTFAVNSSTHRDGIIETGVSVSVRYQEEGASHVATAIAAQHPKQHASAKPASSPQ
jgi:hypothetical protein